MDDSNHPSFDLKGSELLAAALHAQLLTRRRGAFEHDLKNVVHGLLSGTELLAKALTTNPPRFPPAECLRLLQQQLGRAQDTLDRMLEEIAPSEGVAREVDLQQVIEECAHDLRHQLQRFEHRAALEPLLIVRAQRAQLKNVVLSVLIEAMDQAPAGTALTLSLRREGGHGRVEIRHASTGATRAAALSLAQQILPALQIAATVTAGERCISITLPLVDPPIAPQADNAARVIIVDANRDATDSLVMLLKLEGLEAVAAYDAVSALQSAHAHAPTTFVIDVDGSIDSAAFIAQLRTEFPSARILGLSHNEEPAAARVDAQLRKPLDPQALHEVLQNRA
jgi:CheY-like chemotaxis protein